MNRRTIDWITFLLVLCGCGWVLALPLRSHQTLLGYAQDDFYYYLKAAQNFAGGRGPTFDGTTLTNGFQPLYFLVLSAISCFTQDIGTVFKLLWVLDTLSATAIFLLVREVFSRQLKNTYLANTFAIWVVLYCVRMLVLQMEVTLALPLGFAFLVVGFVPAERYIPRRCAALGLLAALMMLSRLDAAILPALFVAGLLLVREYRPVFTGSNIGGFLLGSLPLPVAYFLINLHYFHQLLPISGTAKELRHGWMPTAKALTNFHGTTWIVLGLIVVGSIIGWLMRRHLRPWEKVFCIACFCTPPVFYTVEMFLSDWPLWDWYLYVLRFSLAGCFVLARAVLANGTLLPQWAQPRMAAFGRVITPLFYCATVFMMCGYHYRANAVMMDIQDAALQLDSFARTHPGRYAMGDRAGMFGYITKSPLLQAEGLMMDRRYLGHIRAEDDLKNVLSGYGVKYYVAFREFDNERPGPCFHATEPVIAGQSALRMRADFCDQPLYQFSGIDGTYRVFLLSPSQRRETGPASGLPGSRAGAE